MITDNNTLIFIPARGGSKGLIDKNIRPLAGKPLILHTLDLARSLFDDADICVSTDSQKIIDVVEQTGYKVPFIRPAQLASDTSPTRDSELHALDFYAKKGKCYESILVLQPTSPLRKTEHLTEAIQQFKANDADMVVSVCVTSSNPYYVLFEEDQFGYLKQSKKSNFTRRQDCPVVYEYNGSVYVKKVSKLLEMPVTEFSKIEKFVMDDIYSIDIDTELDLKIAELIISEVKSV